MDIKSELSEENRKLIENWDNKIKVRHLNLTLNEDKTVRSMEVGLQDSPFEGFISKGDVVLERLPKPFMVILNYIIKKISKSLEENVNEEGEY